MVLILFNTDFLVFDKFEISCSLKIKPRQVLTVVRRKGQRGPCPRIPLTSEVAKICLFWDLLGKYCLCFKSKNVIFPTPPPHF